MLKNKKKRFYLIIFLTSIMIKIIKSIIFFIKKIKKIQIKNLDITIVIFD